MVISRLACLALPAMLLACGPHASAPPLTSRSAGPDAAAPARDGDIAIVEEFQAAEQVGTADAYRLFAARHPAHRLAQEAESRARHADAQDLPPTD